LEAKLESRHLGLVTAQEIADLKEKVNRLGETVEQYIDLDGILEIAQSAKQYEIAEKKELCDTKQLRIAVARDKAFCFYYEDNLDLLRQLGCELVEFSPLQEKQLPANIDGLLLGGGYPELYGQQLSANQSLLCELRAAIKNGLPTHAECGGYMYLHETMTDVEGNVYRMAGVLKGSCHFTEQLQHFGYVTLKACTDNLLCEKGCELRAHEFHRCVSDVEQTVFDAVKGNKHWKSYVAGDNLAAGFTHIHYYANPAVAERFVEYCRKYHVKRNEQ
jgi:cobyrinic acid a,c-diamide synthase